MASLLNGQGSMYFVVTTMRSGFQSTQSHTTESIQKAFVIASACGSVALGSRTFLCPQEMRRSGQQAEEEACLALTTVQAGSASAVRCARKEGSVSGCPFWVSTCLTPAPPSRRCLLLHQT